GMWDSWRIDGGSEGDGFAVLPGHWDDPRLLHDMPRWDGWVRPNAPGVCAGGPRGLLDFSDPNLPYERVDRARRDLWNDLTARHRPAAPLSSFQRRWESDPAARAADPDGTAMFAAYRAQPLVQAFFGHPRSPRPGSFRPPFHFNDPVVNYSPDRDPGDE